MKRNAAALIIVGVMLVVVAVAVFAAVVSYGHIFELGRSHGQDGTSARLTPLSVDLLILAASLVLLWAGSNQVEPPQAIRGVLIASVVATIAGNVLDGWSDGPVGAVLNGWPGVAFVAAIEIGIWLVRAWRTVRARGGTASPALASVSPPPRDAVAVAEVAYARSVEGGNPLSQNQLQTQYRLTRAEAAKVRTPTPAAADPAPSLYPPGDGQPPRPVRPPAGTAMPSPVDTVPAGPSSLSNGARRD